jgi:hypothetical protein
MKTLKIALLLSSALAPALPSMAQTLRVQAGAANASMNWQGTKPDGGTMLLFGRKSPGLYLTAGAEVQRNKYFSFSCNAGYIRKGGMDEHIVSEPGSSRPTSYKRALHLDYITANALMECRLPLGKKLNPFISAGPRVDYLVSYNKAAIEQRATDYSLNSLLIGANIGAGIRYTHRAMDLAFQVDYMTDISNAGNFKDPYFGTQTSISSRTVAYSLSLGYALKHKKKNNPDTAPETISPEQPTQQ